MDVYIDLLEDAGEAVEKWTREHGYTINGKHLFKEIRTLDVNSGAEKLADELSTLPLDKTEWQGFVHYQDDDDPFDDGGVVNFQIVNGKVSEYMESRFDMVDAEPWFDFDLTEPKNRLVGFIFDHGEDTSKYYVDLPEDEHDAIMEILNKHVTEGYSER